MKIHGLQKLTLLDFPGRTACTVFTAGCNFRCPFCHNAPLVTTINSQNEYLAEEIFSFLKKRQGLLDGVAITGGEPLLTDGIFDFIREIRDLGFKVKLDTNGSFPERLNKILEEGLVEYVAMDVKQTKEKYSKIIDIKDFDISPINDSIKLLINSKIDYEFRTTVVKEYHQIEDIEGIAKWIEGAKNYFLQSFKDSGELIGDNLSAHPKEILEKMGEIASKYVKNVSIRGIDL